MSKTNPLSPATGDLVEAIADNVISIIKATHPNQPVAQSTITAALLGELIGWAEHEFGQAFVVAIVSGANQMLSEEAPAADSKGPLQ